eukprot:3777002-Prymnesium_polylepis.3
MTTTQRRHLQRQRASYVSPVWLMPNFGVGPGTTGVPRFGPFRAARGPALVRLVRCSRSSVTLPSAQPFPSHDVCYDEHPAPPGKAAACSGCGTVPRLRAPGSGDGGAPRQEEEPKSAPGEAQPGVTVASSRGL